MDSTNSANDRLINNIPVTPDVPFHPDPLLKNPKQQPIKQNIQEINPKINFDFEENSPFCFVGQYASMRIKSLIILSRGNYTAFDSMYCNTQLLVFRFSFLCYT